MFKNKRPVLLTLTALFWGSIAAFAQTNDAAIMKKVNILLKQMTVEEKVGQLNQYSGKALTGPASSKKNSLETEIKNGWVGAMLNVKGAKNTREVQGMALKSRLKIPLLFGLDVIHGYQTTFPIPLAEAASWDMDAIKLSAHIAAKESAASGVHWTFAPMVDISRDPRWGRIMEGAGEDPYLGSMIASARVKGLQGEHLGSTDAIMACAKHFIAYGAAIAGRDYNAVEMSEHELWQTYLPPFKAALDAGAATFMNSFNTVNGIPSTGNDYLLRTILKGKWKYNGFVVSDWNSIGEMTIWGYAADPQDAAMKAIKAGNDMDMEGSIYRKNLVGLIKEGKVSMLLIDDAVKRILYKKFELGLFDNPYKFCDEIREKEVLSDPANLAAARDVARKSMVLLKNERETLPLTKQLKNIALIGPLAKSKKDLNGAWRVNQDTTNIINLYEGLSQGLNEGQKITYASGGTVFKSTDEEIAQAVEISKKADVIIMALGESYELSGESKSRTNLNLPGDQEKLFDALYRTGKPVIVTIFAGRPLIFNTIADKATAILYSWWPGCQGGHAFADVIYGKYNPAAKLPVSFPRSVGQIPIFYSQTNTGRPYNNEPDKLYLSSYIDEENTPKFAFGYGLNYTNFSYSDLHLDKKLIKNNDFLKVSFTLTNTGKLAGEEVAQLYLRDEVASLVRPVKELKDFKKVMLQPGESRKIEFVFSKEKLAFYNNRLVWDTEPGFFQIMIGSSSDHILLKDRFELQASK